MAETILIVDDEPFNVDLLEQELGDLGYETLTAFDGQAAVELVRQQRPDLVLLDVMMPVMDGFTACRLLKEDEETRLIPVIIMTALDRVEDRIQGIEAGADDFLTKPVNDRELVARIQTALKMKAAIEQKVNQVSRLRDHFAKFVPEQVKQLAASNPDAPELSEKIERDVSVLMLDVTGYSKMSEQLPATELNELVERYFSAFLDRIREADGDINETAGDGFMALFMDSQNAAAGSAPHAIRAVDTALDLLHVTESLNAEITQASGGQTPLSVHMGVNSGSALVGSTRFEGTRGTRWTFTASGPVTNVAARLVGVAADGQILIGPQTCKSVGDRYQLEAIGERQLKNLSEPIVVHRVVARSRT
ncbi:MAG: response regulator [Gemmatimonadetes bacterium]|nr:response regulator [Gemmatimonadota bacterium]MBT6148529.1 response regulator [Gemmatimonadota bacterium]MBT7862052.1 response regulator [Gemmatimonadota bacterium]